jgi:glucose/arabinose dehydrogenase
MRRLVAAVAALLAVLVPTLIASAGAGGAPRGGGGLQVETLATGLTVPWDIAFLPDGRALVTERPGRVRLVDAEGRLQERPVARVGVRARGEGGLMGIAVHPRNPSRVFLMVTRSSGVRVLRMRWDGRRLTGERTVLGGIRGGDFHDSGRIRFGPDGHLYVLTGDAGVPSLAQRRGSRNGRVLRLRNGSGRPTEISRGHRNPQGLAWQPGTRRLFATEHGPSGSDGPSCCDEVNQIRRGGNYGWPRWGDQQPPGARPAWLWRSTVAPSGAAFVTRRGSAWTGDLLVATLRGQSLRRLVIDGRSARETQVLLRGRYGRLRAVVEAPDGSIWVTTSNRDGRADPTAQDDRILRIVPPRA